MDNATAPVDDEANLLEFCRLTQAAPDIAQNYLAIADNVVDVAVDLYLNDPNMFPSSTQPEQPARHEPTVRSPIRPKFDIIADSAQAGDAWPRNPGPVAPNPTSSIFNQGDSSRGGATAGHVSGSNERKLADLFRPPFDILTTGDFGEARAQAHEKGKWLLVNLQDPTEFQCQVLNRDLWSEQMVKEIIKVSFVFVQYTDQSSEGQYYRDRYPVKKYPHVAVIDAHTGKRHKVWEGVLAPADFLMEATEFLDMQTESSTPTKTSPKRKKTDVMDMSEEDQVSAAIAASLGESDVAHGPPSRTPEEVEEPSPFDKIEAVQREETTDMANSTRIQLRMENGGRVVRRFLKTDPVRYLFEFIKAEVPDAASREFELVFDRTQLIEKRDQTIEEAGLKNAAVNFQFA